MHTFETATPSPLPALRSSYPSILPWTINLVMHYTNANPTYTWPGSNWRPSACMADVIATRPQVLVQEKTHRQTRFRILNKLLFAPIGPLL